MRLPLQAAILVSNVTIIKSEGEYQIYLGVGDGFEGGYFSCLTTEPPPPPPHLRFTFETKVAARSGKVRGDSELSKSKKELCSRVRHACLSLACLVLSGAHYFQTPAAQAKSLVARVYRRKILQIAIV